MFSLLCHSWNLAKHIKPCFLTYGYCRERTVAFLVSQGAAAGALTDPSPRYPAGRTAADLAASNGDKGIAGYCAEAALSTHLELLKLKDAAKEGSDDFGSKSLQTVSERTPSTGELWGCVSRIVSKGLISC